MLEHHPYHVRKKIALGITIGILIVLLAVMVSLYTGKKEGKKDTSAVNQFSAFYATILDSLQSRKDGNRAIIEGQ